MWLGLCLVLLVPLALAFQKIPDMDQMLKDDCWAMCPDYGYEPVEYCGTDGITHSDLYIILY
ncbi:hypothetical protein KIPB_014488, partial [Kipferlia bialata]|eukprot:g14488.t1